MAQKVLQALVYVLLCYFPLPLRSSAQAAAPQVQLVVKNPLIPSTVVGSLETWKFSPNEKLAAMIDERSVTIYNLALGVVTSRYEFKSPDRFKQLVIRTANFEPLYFTEKGETVLFQDGPHLIRCPASGLGECTQVADGVRGFVVFRHFLLFANAKNIPVLRDLDVAQNDIEFELPVAESDREAFTWWTVNVDTQSPTTPRLLLGGMTKRPRPERAPSDSATVDESHLVLYDLATGHILATYPRIPVHLYPPTGSSVALSGNGHPYACDASGIVDVVKGSYVKGSNLPTLIAQDFLTQCASLASKAKTSQNLGWMFQQPTPKKFNAEASLPKESVYAAVSPSGDAALYFHFNRLYYLNAHSTQSPVLLAGGLIPTTHLNFVRRPMEDQSRDGLGDFILASTGPGVSTFWNFNTGNVWWWPFDVAFSRVGETALAALLVPPLDNGSGIQVILQDMRSSRSTSVPLQLTTLPDWFGISANGDTIVTHTQSGLTAFRSGAKKALSCDSSIDFVNHTSHIAELNPNYTSTYLIDRTGSYLVALCGRSSSNPTLAGTRAYLIVWSLKTFEEQRQIALPGIRMWITTIGGASSIPLGETVSWLSTSYDDKHVVITTSDEGSHGGIRSGRFLIVDLETGAIAEEPKPSGAIWGAILGKQGKTLIIGSSNTDLDSTIEWYDLTTKTVTRAAGATAGFATFAVDEMDDVALATDDGVVTVFSSQGKPLIKAIRSTPAEPGGQQGWIAMTDDGLFDGTPDAMDLVGFRRPNDSSVRNLSSLYNELERPLLLREVGNGHSPHLDPGISLSTYLDVPNLSLLLERGELKPEVRNDRATLCIVRPQIYEELGKVVPVNPPPSLEKDDTSGCPRRFILSDQLDPATEVQALLHLSAPNTKTPWDGIRMQDPGGKIHVLTVAVSKFSPQSDFPPVPTASASARDFERVFETGPTSQSLQIWGQAGCGHSLIDVAATKANILDCLEKLVATAKPEDVVVVFLSGHGGPLNNSELFYYLPSDYAGLQDHSDPSSAISSAELTIRLRGLQARRLVLIMDTCKSAGTLQPLAKIVQAKILQELAGHSSDDRTPTASLPRGALFIAAATALEQTNGDRQRNLFVQTLLKAIDEPQSGERLIWSSDVANAIQNLSDSTAAGAQDADTRPVAISIGATFPIRRTSK